MYIFYDCIVRLLIKINRTTQLLVLMVMITTLSLSVPAFGQEDNLTAIPSLVDGIPTSYLITGVAVIGILLQTYKGMIGKPREDFDVNQLVFTVIVGIGAAIIVVGNAFQNVSPNMTDSSLMIFLVSQILTIMGAKTVTDMGKKFIPKPKTETAEEEEPEPIDDESDLPPGKDTTREID